MKIFDNVKIVFRNIIMLLYIYIGLRIIIFLPKSNGHFQSIFKVSYSYVSYELLAFEFFMYVWFGIILHFVFCKRCADKPVQP